MTSGLTRAEQIKQLESVLAAMKAEAAIEDAVQPAIRSVKVGDLEWQADVPDKRFTWAEAQAYAASLGDGWRLPTIKELLSLVDYDRHKPACSVFPDCPSEPFWSSSAYSGDAALAWDVLFSDGSSYGNVVGADNRVRCVRTVGGAL